MDEQQCSEALASLAGRGVNVTVSVERLYPDGCRDTFTLASVVSWTDEVMDTARALHAVATHLAGRSYHDDAGAPKGEGELVHGTVQRDYGVHAEP